MAIHNIDPEDGDGGSLLDVAIPLRLEVAGSRIQAWWGELFAHNFQLSAPIIWQYARRAIDSLDK
jgi:hypothetical protein